MEMDSLFSILTVRGLPVPFRQALKPSNRIYTGDIIGGLLLELTGEISVWTADMQIFLGKFLHVPTPSPANSVGSMTFSPYEPTAAALEIWIERFWPS
jgi:hypothetical protein